MHVWPHLRYLNEPVEKVGAVLDIHVHVREELAQPDEDLVKVRQDVPSRHLTAGTQRATPRNAQAKQHRNTSETTPTEGRRYTIRSGRISRLRRIPIRQVRSHQARQKTNMRQLYRFEHMPFDCGIVCTISNGS